MLFYKKIANPAACNKFFKCFQDFIERRHNNMQKCLKTIEVSDVQESTDSILFHGAYGHVGQCSGTFSNSCSACIFIFQSIFVTQTICSFHSFTRPY